MKHYLLKLLLFFSPILLVVAIYVVLDPFMVVWHYDDYRVEDRAVFINRAYVSSRVFENQNDTCHYDSFIFGNSTSLNYYVADWQTRNFVGEKPETVGHLRPYFETLKSIGYAGGVSCEPGKGGWGKSEVLAKNLETTLKTLKSLV